GGVADTDDSRRRLHLDDEPARKREAALVAGRVPPAERVRVPDAPALGGRLEQSAPDVDDGARRVLAHRAIPLSARRSRARPLSRRSTAPARSPPVIATWARSGSSP